MKFVATLDEVLADLFVRFPHLSRSLRESLARNVWWLAALIGSLGGLFAIYLVIAGLFMGLGEAVSFNLFGVLVIADLWISAALSAMISVILLFSSKPLSRRQLQGWRGLYFAWLMTAVFTIYLGIINPSRRLVLAVVAMIALAYLLYEIRDVFGAKAKKQKKSARTTKEAAADTPRAKKSRK